MPIKVLHIEDNPGDAMLLRETLHSAGASGFELAQVNRLSAGMDRLAAEEFDVVLLDLSLPDSFGIETYKRVRERSPNVPVIVLSGLDDEAAAIQTVHAGAQDYLCKDDLGERLLTRSIRYAIERHRSDLALDAERRLLRSLIDALPDQIYVKDCASKFVACNTAVSSRLGFATPDAVIGKSDFDFFSRADAESHFQEEIAVFSGRPRVNREERVEIAGQTRWLLITKVPLYGKNGKIAGLVGINRDITERKLAEDQLVRLLSDLKKTNADLKAAQLQLIQAEKMESVGRLAAGVAHEVKNPLAVAVMGLDYMKNKLGADHPAAPVLKEIYDAIKRADTVIGGLLDFSRPRTLVVKPEELNAIVLDSLEMVRHDLAKKGIDTVKNLAEALPRIRLDGNKIKQVFINLFLNAIHAMPNEGTLTVSTFAATAGELRDHNVVSPPERFGANAAMLAVSIEDTGPGISTELMTKIFDPYFTTKPVGEGTGLGLSVARQIVELHGGVLDIRNRGVGGARAIVALRVVSGDTKIVE